LQSGSTWGKKCACLNALGLPEGGRERLRLLPKCGRMVGKLWVERNILPKGARGRKGGVSDIFKGRDCEERSSPVLSRKRDRITVFNLAFSIASGQLRKNHTTKRAQKAWVGDQRYRGRGEG